MHNWLYFGPIKVFIFGLIFEVSYVYFSLKDALIRPVINDMNGNLDDDKNCRLISNLPFRSKIIENCTHKQLLSHFSLHITFVLNFRVGITHISCKTATLAIYNDLIFYLTQKYNYFSSDNTVYHKFKLHCHFRLKIIVDPTHIRVINHSRLMLINQSLVDVFWLL